MRANEKQWRRRNPDLAARFDRLPKAAQANIRTAFTGNARGVSKLLRTADLQRRKKESARSQHRRDKAKAQRWFDHFMVLDSRARKDRANRPLDMTASQERLAWEMYDRGMGR